MSKSNDLNELLKANKSQDGAHKSRGRIKFALRRDELEERISDLVDSINRLGKLRDISASLQDYSIQHCSRTMAEVAAFLQHVQDNAKLLYGAMERELASGCHNEHATRFYLEGHSAVLQKRQMPTIFKLALEAPEARMVGQDLDREISIEVLDDDMDGYGPVNLSSCSKCTNGERRPISEEEFEKAGVGFVLTDPSKAPDELMSKALDMCLAIDRARKEGKTMKMSLSPCGALHGWYILPLFGERTDRDHSTFELVTLEQVLLKKLCHEPSRLEWNVIQRMNLSLNLASSLLQLCSTPWLSEPWTKRTICFRRRLRPTPASGVAFVFEPDRPFLVHSFSERPIACPTNELEPRYQLLNLGILLLELGHEKPIELWASAHGYNLDKAYGNRYEAAAAWLRDSVGELLPSYFDAAGRCIECTFCTRSAIPKWDDPEFRKSICEWVIQPLWSNCSSTMSI